MTKKQNSLLFILIGTIVNIILAIFFIIIISFIGIKLFPAQAPIVITIAFVGGFILGMFVYSKLATFVIKKFNLEDKLDPLFVKKRKY